MRDVTFLRNTTNAKFRKCYFNIWKLKARMTELKLTG